MKRLGVLMMVILGAMLGFWSYLSMPKPAQEKPQEYPPKVIKLPKPRTQGTVSLEESLARRRSIREYTEQPLSIEQLSQLLWAAQGITLPTWGFRTAPSAGATYPLELYVVVGKECVNGLEEGVYRYDPKSETLTFIADGDRRRDLSIAALGQEWVAGARVDIVITALYERTTRRYGERGVRYVHMEAGHVSENIYLQAAAMGLATVTIGAFYDEQVKKVLELPKELEPLYIHPVGYPR